MDSIHELHDVYCLGCKTRHDTVTLNEVVTLTVRGSPRYQGKGVCENGRTWCKMIKLQDVPEDFKKQTPDEDVVKSIEVFEKGAEIAAVKIEEVLEVQPSTDIDSLDIPISETKKETSTDDPVIITDAPQTYYDGTNGLEEEEEEEEEGEDEEVVSDDTVIDTVDTRSTNVIQNEENVIRIKEDLFLPTMRDESVIREPEIKEVTVVKPIRMQDDIVRHPDIVRQPYSSSENAVPRKVMVRPSTISARRPNTPNRNRPPIRRPDVDPATPNRPLRPDVNLRAAEDDLDSVSKAAKVGAFMGTSMFEAVGSDYVKYVRQNWQRTKISERNYEAFEKAYLRAGNNSESTAVLPAEEQMSGRAVAGIASIGILAAWVASQIRK